jgi:hypothetical protein
MLSPTPLRRLCYSPLRLAAKEHRFEVACRIAKWIEPVLRRLGRPALPPLLLGSFREFSTSAFLQSLTQAGVEFDPVMNVTFIGDRPKGPSILVSGHFYLDFLFIRWVHDNIASPGVFLLTGADEWLILGTQVPMETLAPGHRSLFETRRVLGSGRPVIAAIDHFLSAGKEWERLPIDERELYASRALLKYAARANVPLFFFDTFFDGDGVRAIVERISTDDAFSEYSRCLSQALDRRSATHDIPLGSLASGAVSEIS